MGEGEESLEEMLDLFPEGQDEHRPAQTRRIHISGADERACASFAEQESQQHFAMHQVMPDLDQMLGGPDQDGDVFGVLANNSSSGWDAAQQSPEAPSRALPSVTAWDDFPAVQESGNTCDASSDGSPHPNALRSSDRSPGKSILAAGQAVEARHLGDEQADDTDAKRTSSRKRSTTSRFDPVKDGAHPRRGGGHKRVKLKDGSGNLERSEMVGASIAPVSKRKRKVKTPPSHEAHAPTEASSTKITSAMGRPGRPRNRAQDLGLERGKHVARKPEMQKTARAGQKRWKELLVKMRAELEESPTSAAFGRQLSECKRQKLKSQKEALLLFLQAASRDGLIRPGKFSDPKDASKGFIGWTSFTVVARTANEFHAGVEDLFGEGSKPKTNTVHNIFRRAGLVPSTWADGWQGRAPFSYRGS